MKLILAIVLCACAINTSHAFGLPSLPSMPSPCTALEAVAGEAVEFIGGCISANVSIIPGGASAVAALTKKAHEAVVGAIKSHCRRNRRELGLMGAACHTAIGPLCSVAIKAADVAAKAALVSVGIPTVVSGCILATLEKQVSAKCTGLCRRRAFGLPSLPSLPSMPSPCTALEAVAGEAVEFIGGCISANVSIIP